MDYSILPCSLPHDYKEHIDTKSDIEVSYTEKDSFLQNTGDLLQRLSDQYSELFQSLDKEDAVQMQQVCGFKGRVVTEMNYLTTNLKEVSDYQQAAQFQKKISSLIEETLSIARHIPSDQKKSGSVQLIAVADSLLNLDQILMNKVIDLSIE